MRFSSRRQRKPVRLGPMQSERALPTISGWLAVLIKYGFQPKDTKLKGHGCYSEFMRVASDPAVVRARDIVREKMTPQRGGLFSIIAETDAALGTLTEAQLLQCRARVMLNDFRL